MGAPSDQFLHLLWRPPYVFFFILYGGPSDHFFAYYIGAPRSLSSLTIWRPSDQFLLTQISFIVYYMGPPPLRSVPLHAIGGWGAPHILVFSQNIWGLPQISFSAYYMGPPQVSFFTYYMGSPQISFFSYYMGPFRSVFFRILYGGPLRSVSSHTIWGSPEISFSLTI